MFNIENLVLRVRTEFSGFTGKDYVLYWSTGALQYIKFQAPNYKQISNFHPVESSGGGPPRGGIPQGKY